MAYRLKNFMCFLVIACCLSIAGFSKIPKTDVLMLKNGNLISGEIKKLQYGILEFKTDNISTLTIRWTDILKIKSTHLFEVILNDQTVHLCSLDSTTTKREVTLVTADKNRVVNMSQIVNITGINKAFFSRLDGSINMGVNYTKSSSILQFNLAGNVTYTTFHNRVNLTGTSDITRQNISDSIDVNRNQDLTISYQRFFNKEWFVSGMTGIQQNLELGVNLRVLLGAGGGKDLFETDIHTISVMAAPFYTREYSDSATINSAEAGFMLNYRIYKYKKPRVVLTTRINTFPSLTEKGRVRLQADINLSIEIISDFKISFTNYHNYDNKPVDTSASKYDWGITSSIGYTF